MATTEVERERLLAERVRRGDCAAEAELVARYYRRVLAAVIPRVRSREDALDITQEVLVGVLRGLREGRLRDPDHLSRYVSGTTRNVVKRTLGERASLGQVDLELVSSGAPTADRVVSSREELQAVRRAFNELPLRDRGIVAVAVVSGMTLSELARRTDMSADQVRQRKARAIRRVRRRSQMLG